MSEPLPPSCDLDEELRISALSALRWRVVIGLALAHIFAGSHPHLDLVYGPQYRFPSLIAAPVTGCLCISEWIALHGIWPVLLAFGAYVVLDRSSLRRSSTQTLLAWGRVVGLTLAGIVVAFNLPFIRLLWGGV